MLRMFLVGVEAAHSRLSFGNIVGNGVDEMNRRKGQNYLIMLKDLKTKRLIYATTVEDASVWAAFAKESLLHNGRPEADQPAVIGISVP
jgi:hypothetical protein